VNSLLVACVTVTNATRSEFTYDGKMRRRIRKEYVWKSGIWNFQSETRYVYDGNLLLQERDGNNLPLRGYTRGKDLGAGLKGAGGIGGLLAFAQLANGIARHYFYHADGNGNVTMLINGFQAPVAKYVYEPFASPIYSTGPMAEANIYRFSSKEYDANSGLVLFPFRAYDTESQRWLNRDPLGESRGGGLYVFVANAPTCFLDPDGLWYQVQPGLFVGTALGEGAVCAGLLAAGGPPITLWVLMQGVQDPNCIYPDPERTGIHNPVPLKAACDLPHDTDPKHHPNYQKNWDCQRPAEKRYDDGQITLEQYSEALRECNRLYPLYP
jgi:RHS repeat-associated protein